MNTITILLSYRKKIVIWMIAGGLIFTASYYGIDKKLIVLTAFIVGVFTEIFTGIGVLVAAIPVVGPMIIKIVSIPIFWILNALGTLISGIAIKKGYATELAKGRIMTLALLIGMIIGYIIGNLIPLQ
jgi:hypothetical protein